MLPISNPQLFAIPLRPLEDELNQVFGARPSEFSNRVAIFCDALAERVFGLFQVANTMPLGLCMATDTLGIPGGFSFLLEKPIAAREPERSEWHATSLITWKQFEWSAFSGRGKHAIAFGFDKFFQSIEREHGRAVVFVDNHSDKEVVDTLIAYANMIANEGVKDDRLIGDLMVKVLKLRFQENGIPEWRWRQVGDETAVAYSGNVENLVAALRDRGDFGSDQGEILSSFREHLNRLVDQYGFPKMFCRVPPQCKIPIDR